MKQIFLAILLVCSSFFVAQAQQVYFPSPSMHVYDSIKLAKANAYNASHTTRKAMPFKTVKAKSIKNYALPLLHKELNCYSAPDSTFIVAPIDPENEDGSYGPINLGFNFNLYGTIYTQVWINVNGSLTFTGPLDTYSSTSFPTNFPIVAGFWADVDFRGAACGNISYKLTSTSLIVNYTNAGYFSVNDNLLNTFQIIISDGTDPLTYDYSNSTQGNVAFNYKDMNWTTGDASDGIVGFGGIPATVGVDDGLGHYVQIGRFGLDSTNYDSSNTAINGVHWLDSSCFKFSIDSSSNLPPILFSGNTIDTIRLYCGDTTNLHFAFSAPEVSQTVSASVNSGGIANFSSTILNGDTATIDVVIVGSTSNYGTHVITIAATDNFSPPATTVKQFVAIISPITSNIQPIIGDSSFCAGSTLQLSESSTGGYWTSSDPAIATVDNNGLVTGLSTGNVSISYHLSNACVNDIVSKTITVNPTPVVAPISGSSLICLNGASNTTVQLTDATPDGVWSVDDPSIVTIDASGLVTAHDQAVGLVYYTVTNATGCSATVQHTIEANYAPAPPTIVLPKATICERESIQLTADPSGGIWASADPNIVAIDAGSGWATGVKSGYIEIVYSYTEPSTSCSVQSAVGINVTNDCDINPICKGVINETLEGDFTDRVFDGGSYYVANPVFFYGNIVLRNTDVVVAPGASITISPNATVTIEGSHLYSCTEMWQGINVQTGGYLRITGNSLHSSLIEDAMTAVTLNFNQSLKPVGSMRYFLDIDNTVFNKNLKSISIANYLNEDLTDYPFSIKNTVFTCRDIYSSVGNWPDVATVKGITPIAALMGNPTRIANEMSAPYISDIQFPADNRYAYLKTPLDGQKSELAIELNNIGWLRNANSFGGITIGKSQSEAEPTNTTIKTNPAIANGLTYNTNVFDNMVKEGIDAQNANLKVVNSVFQKPYFFPDKIATTHCWGIFCRTENEEHIPHKLEVLQEDAGLPKNGFFDMSVAINSNYEFVEVNNNEIRSALKSTADNGAGLYGIHLPIPYTVQLNANNNRLYNINNPIYLQDEDENYGLADPRSININGNEIGLSSNSTTVGSEQVHTGIWLSSRSRNNVVYPVMCNNNQIVGAYNGIRISDWTGKPIDVQTNNIQLVHDGNTTEQFGIRCEKLVTPRCRVSDNLINGDDDGSTGNANASDIVVAMSNNVRVTCNRVKSGLHGLRFWSVNSNAVVRDNAIEASNLNGLTLDEQGVVGQQGTTTYASGNVWEGNWNSTTGHYKTACINSSDAQWSPLYVDQSDPIYDPSNSYVFTVLTPYSASYGTIIPMNDAGNSHCTARTVRINTPVKIPFIGGQPKIVPVTQNLTAQRTISYDELIAQGALPLGGADSAQRLYVLQQQLYAQLLRDSATLNNSSTFQSFVGLNAYGNIGQLYAIDSLLGKGDTARVQDQLANITLSNVVDIHYVQYYQWLLKLWNGAGLQGTDTAAIYALAQGCPAIDGSVVYAARNLYNRVTTSAINFIDACPKSSSRKKIETVNGKTSSKTIVSTNTRNVLVFPNPTRGKLILEIPSTDYGKRRMIITNMFGKTIFEKNIAAEQNRFEINITGNTGIYFMKMVDENTGKEISRQSIIKL